MPPKSNARKIESLNGDSDASNSNNSPSTKRTNKKQPRKRSGDTSTSTTNEPSSTSIVRARHLRALPLATATTAAASTVPQSVKKPRKAGFREQFLQELRVMLDRESQNDDAAVHWSTGGNSFIITDQTQFEEEIIPKYFGNPIVFASFLRKLQRWGFVRAPSIRSGRYEFSSPTFKRMDSRSASSAAAATNTTANAVGNDGGGASTSFPQQQQQQHRQQVMAQLDQHPMPVLNQLPRQANGSAIADIISNIQRSTQQPPTSSQPPGPNQVTIQMNLADINNILQNIIGSNQHQPIASQNSLPNQQPVPNLASQLNNVAGINHLQSFPQWQHPNNPTMNLLNAALQSLGRGLTPPAQTMGQYPPSSAQSNAGHTLMSRAGMLPQSPPPNTAPVASGMSTAASSQPNDVSPVLFFLQILQRFVDEEDERRVQVDTFLNAMLVIIGRVSGQGFHNNNAAQPQPAGAPPLSRQSLGSNNNNVAQPNQLGASHPSNSSLWAALRGDATGQPGENARAQNYGPAKDNNNDSEDDIDEYSEEEDEHLSTKRRKSSPEDEDQWDSDDDDDSWNERLRPRKK